jgi:hypothetical protein
MPPIYKYVSQERFAHALMEEGQVFMQTLTNFRGYEENDPRRDPNDGRLRFQPRQGLEVHVEGREPELLVDWAATFSVKADDIFVFCLSTIRSEELASHFEAPFCVEISNPIRFISLLRSKVRLRSALDKAVHFGSVEYRQHEAPPGATWALPEQVAFVKPEGYALENEFRVVVGRKGVFDLHNLDMQLERGPQPLEPRERQDPLILKVGNLSRITNLHRF